MGQGVGQISLTKQLLLQNIEPRHSTFGVQNLSPINKEKSSEVVGDSGKDSDRIEYKSTLLNLPIR